MCKAFLALAMLLCAVLASGKEDNWVIILATGRSGSTTVNHMVNLLPGVSVMGENRALVELLDPVYENSLKCPRNTQEGAWFNVPFDENIMLNALRNVVKAHIGAYDKYKSSTHIGYKEIRHDSAEKLAWVKKMFPKAKFLINYRKNVTNQAKSAFYKHANVDPEETITAKNNALLTFANSLPEHQRYILPLEDFSVELFNGMIKFLGFEGCEYGKLVHDNAHGGYKVDNKSDELLGTCVYVPKQAETTTKRKPLVHLTNK